MLYFLGGRSTENPYKFDLQAIMDKSSSKVKVKKSPAHPVDYRCMPGSAILVNYDAFSYHNMPFKLWQITGMKLADFQFFYSTVAKSSPPVAEKAD